MGCGRFGCFVLYSLVCATSLLCVTSTEIEDLQNVDLILASTDSASSQDTSLFMTTSNLTLYCSLVANPGNVVDIASLMQDLNESSILPVLTVRNHSWVQQFNFTDLDATTQTWSLILMNVDLWINTSAWYPKEQWKVNVSLTDGSTVVTSVTSSLMNTATEPLLKWFLGAAIPAPDLSSAEDTILAVSPCAPDVALIVPTGDTWTEGVLFGVTSAGFQDSLTWYNVTNKICQLDAASCSSSLLDVTVTNHHVMVLMTDGLYVSNDLRYPDLNQSESVLQFSRTLAIGQSAPCDTIQSGHINFVSQCQHRQHEIFQEDVLTVVYSCPGENPTAVYSHSGFTNWTNIYSEVAPPGDLDSILDLAFNSHTSSFLILYNTLSGSQAVEERRMNNSGSVSSTPYFPRFTFPAGSNLTRLTLMPMYQFIYAYGKQMWLSEDGGNSFRHLHTSTDDGTVIGLSLNWHHGVVLAETSTDMLLYGKAGVPRLAELSVSLSTNHSVHINSRGGVILLSTSSGMLEAAVLDIDMELQSASTTGSRPLVVQPMAGKDVFLFEHVASAADMSASSIFSRSNIGQLVMASSGGSGMISDVSHSVRYLGYRSRVHLHVLAPFKTESTSTSPAQLQTLEVTTWDASTGEVTLTLTDLDGPEVGWVTADVPKTAVIPGSVSFLLWSRISASVMLGYATVFINQSITVTTGNWYITDMSTWTLSEDACRHSLQLDRTLAGKTMFTLDITDSLHFSVQGNTSNSLQRWNEDGMFSSLSNPWLFEVRSSQSFSYLPQYHQVLNFSVSSGVLRKGMTSLRVQSTGASLRCPTPSLLVVLNAGCPCTKRLEYWYPINLTREQFLYQNPVINGTSMVMLLSTNYRPPSKIGVGIPTNDFIYNADPSEPRQRNTFKVSKRTGAFGQCEGRSRRSECGCTEDMKYSADTRFTDCRERAYRLVQRSLLIPKFSIHQEGRDSVPLTEHDVILLREVNSRDPPVYTTRTSVTLTAMKADSSLSNLGRFLNPAGVSIGLNVYVDSAPIAYPLEYILKFGMAIIIGGLLLVIYLWYLRQHHTHRLRQLGPLCPEPHQVIHQEGNYPPTKSRSKTE